MDKQEVTFAQLIDEIKPKLDRLHEIVKSKGFSYKSIGWDTDAANQKLQMANERVKVAEQTLAEINEQIRQKRADIDNDVVVVQARQQAEEFKKKAIREFEFIHENKELVEKKLYKQMADSIAS